MKADYKPDSSVHPIYIGVATWLLGINLTCSYLASDQAEHQRPWASCSVKYLVMPVLFNILLIIESISVKLWHGQEKHGGTGERERESE